MSLSGFVQHFWLGVFTPLTAVCVIPLYPAFIAFLASTEQGEQSQNPVLLGLLVVAGVVTFMSVVGVVYSLVFAEAVNSAVETFSPVAFWVLVGVGLVMFVNPALFSRLSTVDPPQSQYPLASAFSYGFFFGAIAIPCNPGLIAVFFSTTPILYDTQVANMLGFLSFGLGMGAPLLALAALASVAESLGQRVTRGLARHSTLIYRGTGVVLIAVSAYYLAFVLPPVPAGLS
jgi:cytochrome c-type biogenesis protein